MISMLRHVNAYIGRLSDSIPGKVIKLENIKIYPTGYKENNDFPEIPAMQPYEWGSPWGGAYDSHAWFYIPVDVPEDMQGDDTLELCLHTDRGGWDADNGAACARGRAGWVEYSVTAPSAGIYGEIKYDWTPAANDEDAFIQEAIRIRNHNFDLFERLNLINSPGENYLQRYGY